MKCYKIHLIRHGITIANEKGQYVGSTDVSITTNGIISLKALKDEGIYPEVEKVYSSPMKRCIMTAECIYPGREITEIEQLRELDFGDFEGKTAQELENDQQFRLWTAGKISSLPNGEDFGEFSKRICVGLNKVIWDLSKSPNTEAAVIMHGGVIMQLLSLCGLPQKKSVEWTCAAGCGYTIRVTPSLYARSGIVEVIGEIR